MHNEGITLKKIQTFLSFMQTLNLARTAEELNISVVSAHRSIHSLERAIGCSLFTHQGRVLIPLNTARVFEEKVKHIFEDLEESIEVTRYESGIVSNRLRIGCLNSLTVDTVPDLVKYTKERRPDLEFDLVCGTNDVLMKDLINRKLDSVLLTVNRTALDLSRFETVTLFTDKFFLVVPKNDRNTFYKLENLSRFKKSTFVVVDEKYSTGSAIKNVFENAGFVPQVSIKTENIISLVQLVQKGLGFTLLPGRMRKAYGDVVQFVELAPSLQMRQTISIVFEKSRRSDPRLIPFLVEARLYQTHWMKNLV